MKIKLKFLTGKKSEAGFTLMEIMVAIVILAIVMGASYASFSALAGTDQAMGPMLKNLEEARRTVVWLERDFSSTSVSLPPAYRKPELFEDEPDPFRFEAWEESFGNGRFSGVRFTADAHLSLFGSTLKGVTLISYTIGEKKDGSLALYRSDHIHPYPDHERTEVLRFLVSENIQKFTLDFLDEKGEWHREWDSESNRYGWATPRAVRVRLETGKGADAKPMETEISIPVWRESQGDL
ncbi:prepilin-type N-terminal cleavage/methylation domain-containing protein [Desulfobotulus mexicanus]|uniref:Type II secretion system protein J n=1 Tax=Desulfobotulus mexicanus TaxID=2586642 RepID=A0A5Q4VDI6_9BACT|nr:prepilin-type N-terminal cleavage/methylation domain-containing protein [Desulfobotulus mexicanus]TYT75764.1 prepilin-type N-terminal cleavage/methylation domain-containing protein [Desulfobotulus mexicanus]